MKTLSEQVKDLEDQIAELKSHDGYTLEKFKEKLKVLRTLSYFWDEDGEGWNHASSFANPEFFANLGKLSELLKNVSYFQFLGDKFMWKLRPDITRQDVWDILKDVHSLD